MVTVSTMPRLRRDRTAPVRGCTSAQYVASGVLGSGVKDMLALLGVQVGEDLLGCLAERRRGPQRPYPRVAEPQRTAGHRHPPAAGVVDVADHAALDQVLVRVDLTE